MFRAKTRDNFTEILLKQHFRQYFGSFSTNANRINQTETKPGKDADSVGTQLGPRWDPEAKFFSFKIFSFCFEFFFLDKKFKKNVRPG